MGLYKRCAHKHWEKCPDPWWARVKLRGESGERRLNLERWAGVRLTTRRLALQEFARWKESLRTEIPRAGARTLPELVDLWLTRKASRLRDFQCVRYRIAKMLTMLPKRFPTPTDVELFRNHLEDLGLKPATRNRYLADLRRIGNWGKEHDLVHAWPRIKIQSEDNRRRFRVTPEMERGLLAIAEPDARDLIILALDTGLRLGELLSLRAADIEQNLILIRGTVAKSGKGRQVPLATSRSREVIQRRSSVPGLLFPRTRSAYRGAWERARATAGIPHIVFHDLRAEYASRLVGLGVPLSHVRDLLGHSSIVVTERYDRLYLETLKESTQKLEGRV